MSDDERQIPAHKLVLSACSDFFKSILRNNSHSHPLLYLSGIHSTNLSLILDYIYQGETQIYHEDLENFLEVAHKLKIEGLITTNDNDNISSTKHEDQEEKSLKPNAADPDTEVFCSEETEGEIIKIRKSRLERTGAVTVENNSAAEEIIQSNLIKEDGGYRCNICDFSRRGKGDITRHIESHIEGLSYSCPECEKTFRSRHSLQTHKPKHKSNFQKF